MADKPIRIQRKRSKGWKNPPNTVYVGRPSKWGNPYKANATCNKEDVVRIFQDYLDVYEMADEIKKELKGKNLSCWCKIGEPCHADILLEIANQ